MQLHFTPEELKELALVLERQAAEKQGTAKAKAYALLEHVIAHDFRLAFDELEDLQDLLAEYEYAFRKRLADAAAPEVQSGLKLEGKLLEKVIDKVTEACAMV
jgi:hypothetical protein